MGNVARDGLAQRAPKTGTGSSSEESLPLEYARGIGSGFAPSVVVVSLGCRFPDMYGAGALSVLFGMTVIFGVAHRVGLIRDSGPTV